MATPLSRHVLLKPLHNLSRLIQTGFNAGATQVTLDSPLPDTPVALLVGGDAGEVLVADSLVSGATYNVTRGQDGTSAASHSALEVAEAVNAVEFYDRLQQVLGDLDRHLIDPRTYGARGDGQLVNDGVLNASSTTLTSATAHFVAGDAGKLVEVNGAGFAGSPLLTTIFSVTNSTTVVLTAPAATSVTVAQVVWGTDDSQAFRACFLTDLVGAITTGTPTITTTTYQWTAADVGRAIRVTGAGAAGAALKTTIAAVVDGRTVTLAANAGTTVAAALVTLAAMPWGVGWNGTVVQIPRGLYLLNASFDVPFPVVLRGAGIGATVLYQCNTACQGFWFWDHAAVEHLTYQMANAPRLERRFTGTIPNGSLLLTLTGSALVGTGTPNDLGIAIKVPGAGAAGADLNTTISSIALPAAGQQVVTLAAPAQTAVTSPVVVSFPWLSSYHSFGLDYPNAVPLFGSTYRNGVRLLFRHLELLNVDMGPYCDGNANYGGTPTQNVESFLMEWCRVTINPSHWNNQNAVNATARPSYCLDATVRDCTLDNTSNTPTTLENNIYPTTCRTLVVERCNINGGIGVKPTVSDSLEWEQCIIQKNRFTHSVIAINVILTTTRLDELYISENRVVNSIGYVDAADVHITHTTTSCAIGLLVFHRNRFINSYGPCIRMNAASGMAYEVVILSENEYSQWSQGADAPAIYTITQSGSPAWDFLFIRDEVAIGRVGHSIQYYDPSSVAWLQVSSGAFYEANCTSTSDKLAPAVSGAGSASLTANNAGTGGGPAGKAVGRWVPMTVLNIPGYVPWFPKT